MICYFHLDILLEALPMVAEVLFDLPIDKSWTYLVPEKLQAKLQPFTRVIANFKGETKVGLVSHIKRLPTSVREFSYELKPIERIIDKHRLLNEEQWQLAHELAKYYFSSLGEAIFTMIPGGRKEKSFFYPSPKTSSIDLPPLNAEQQKSMEDILHPKEPHKIQTHLIYGITGSGKTRIYLELAQRYLSHGQGVIFLLPEIALSYQFLEQLKPLFGQELAILHSGLTRAQRLAEYRRVLEGQARIVIGTRSAIFAPVQNLSLIILDEEHDSSYKEHASPPYHAKRVAYLRLKLSPNVGSLPKNLILGSATPSLESYHLAQQNTFQLHQLKAQATGIRLAEIHVPLYHKKMGPLSPFLKEKMEYHLARGNQIILLINRRGHSNFAFCETCETSVLCPHCSVSLTYHRDSNLICHLCGYQQPYTPYCASCRGKLTLYGSGTQKVEELLEYHFPKVPFARLDHDVAQNRDYVREILEEVRQGKIKILLGTQMIAKGFDLPGVTLVGILNADQGLSLPDFRASERVFQLLVQAAGRAGRHQKGEVVMQTMMPHHPAIQAAITGNHEAFYAQELALRQQAGYPPFTSLFRLVLSSTDKTALEAAIYKLTNYLNSQLLQTDLFYTPKKLPQILGPAPAPLEKIKDEYRMHLLMKDSSKETVHNTAMSLVKALESGLLKTNVVRWQADMDPVDLL